MSPQESNMDIMPLTLPSPRSSSSQTFLRPMRGVPDIMVLSMIAMLAVLGVVAYLLMRTRG